MKRVAINGFGRIGRQVFQAGVHCDEIEWVAVNDLTDTRTLAHLLKYDSVHGRFFGEVSYAQDSLAVNGKVIKVLAQRNPEQLPWAEMGVDVVVESTGFFTSREGAAKHILAGARKVLISAPAKDPDFTVVKGVNEHLYDRETHHIISNASCTTNCLAPIVKVLNDNYGVRRGLLNTVHSYTADQRLVDAPHKDLRRARHAALSVIPTSTGAARAVAYVIPEMKGRLDGIALRVPTPSGSVVDFVAELNINVTAEQVNRLFHSVGNCELKGIIEYTEDPIVTADIVHNPHSCIFDASLTYVMDGNMLRVVGWYDNEWGYSNRIIDIIRLL